MLKRILAVFLVLLLLIPFSGCGASEKSSGSDDLKIVVTVFPEYDWIRNILGDDVEADIVLLLDSGVDLHNYQPTAQDIVNISDCDMFVYVGGESDSWVEDIVKAADNPDMISVSLMDVLAERVVEEEIVDGMEAEDGETETSEETEYDEHVWLSLKNAVCVCQELCDTISKIDPDHADVYSTNTESYISKLQALDTEYTEMTQSCEFRTLVFADRFPFRYLAEDYDLEYYAAFSGCSAETEASFETIMFLAKKIDENKLRYVMKIEGSKDDIANTVISSTESGDQEIIVVDSIQSVTEKDIKDGADYLEIMKNNLELFRKALN